MTIKMLNEQQRNKFTHKYTNVGIMLPTANAFMPRKILITKHCAQNVYDRLRVFQ